MHVFIDLSEEDLPDPEIERISYGTPLLVIGEKKILLSEAQLLSIAGACSRAVLERA